jgi:hypothetical protein
MSGCAIIGVHPVDAEEPVHLVELRLAADHGPISWSAITQRIEGIDRAYWQLPHDERPIPRQPGSWCFFLHYLDPSRPLSTPWGDLDLPRPTPLPEHLRFIRYVEP